MNSGKNNFLVTSKKISFKAKQPVLCEEFSLEVKNRKGFGLRSVEAVHSVASTFQGSVMLIKGKNKFDLKKMDVFSLLAGLASEKGEQLKAKIKSPEAPKIAKAFNDIFSAIDDIELPKIVKKFVKQF